MWQEIRRVDTNKWYDAILTGKHGLHLFALPLKEEFTVVLHPKMHHKNEPPLRQGDSIRMRIKVNETARAEFKAKHEVVEYQKLEPIADTRLSNNDTVLLTTVALPVEYCDNGRFLMFESKIFGVIIDYKNIVPRNAQLNIPRKLEIRAFSSPRKKFASIYIVSDDFGCYSGDDLDKFIPSLRPPSNFNFEERKTNNTNTSYDGSSWIDSEYQYDRLHSSQQHNEYDEQCSMNTNRKDEYDIEQTSTRRETNERVDSEPIPMDPFEHSLNPEITIEEKTLLEITNRLWQNKIIRQTIEMVDIKTYYTMMNIVHHLD